MKIQSAKAGIGTGRAGLQAASGLFSNAGLFDKGVKSFNPLDLDPYLLFDAQTSMIGTLENPTLDLDPSKQDTLDIITATRAGTATFTDANGLIATAPSDTVRVDYVDSVPMILVEPSATNLVTYSEDFSNAAWIKSAVGTGVAPVVTLNAAESPDGTNNATKIVFDSGSGTTTDDLSTLEDYFNTTSGTSYTQSIYLKGESGGEKILLRNAGNSSYTTVTLTTEWARYSVTETAALNFGYFSIGLRQGLGGVVMNSKITVYAYGAQVETGSVATSYIPTSGGDAAARTRAADDLVISGSAFTDFYNASEGTWYCEAVPKGNDGSENYTFILEYGTANTDRVGFFYYVADGSLSVTGFNSNSQYYNQTKLGDSTNQLARLSYSYESGNHKSAINGTSDSDTDTVVPPANQLKLGKRIVGTNGSLVGHIKRVLFWPYSSDRL